MKNTWTISQVTSGLTAVVVGYSSAVVIVIDVAKRAGATDAMVVSWLLALGVGMGITCIAYSWLTKMPVVTAWSTPGAAFLIGSVEQYTLPETIGAFFTSAVLGILAVQSRHLLSFIKRIPPAISAALLAGILMPICLSIFSDIGAYPFIIGLFLAVYIIGCRWFSRYLMLVLLVLSLVVASQLSDDFVITTVALPAPVWVAPEFSLSATVGLAAPLFLITMLSQNLPGIAIHHAHGYFLDHKPVLTGIGVVQFLLAGFGGFTFNLAAITAALCMSEQVDSDKTQRYKAAIAAGVGYLLMGLCASVVATLFVSMPLVIVHVLAGLALVSTLQNALARALETPRYQQPALLTFLCSASGFTLFSITSAVWGLALGLLLMLVHKKRLNN
jgi:benzoate membrane transport protein